MPGSKKYLTSFVLAFTLLGCSAQTKNLDIKIKDNPNYITVKHKKFILEDQYIIYALENEQQKKFDVARNTYYNLFSKTNKYEYLVKFLSLNFIMNDFNTIKKYAKENIIEGIKEEEQILRLYILSLFKLKEYDSSIYHAENLVNKFYKDVNLELLATIYLQKKEYKKASNSFHKAYLLNKNSRTLLSLSNIDFFYLKKEKETINLLEEYLKNNDSNYGIAIQLLSFYEVQKSNDKAISLLKKMYFKNKNKELLKRIKILLLKYLTKKDSNEALEFFEKNEKEPQVLLALYRLTNKPHKALEILNKLYSNTNNYDYLAQIAILEFELAKDKLSVLESVIKKFSKALEKVNNPVYQNYLAYLLIDYDKDIKKGILLVNKALEKEPDNIAYIDTLAWGEYKLNNCNNAYKQMKKVVDKAGLEEKEIKFHWEKIKECIK